MKNFIRISMLIVAVAVLSMGLTLHSLRAQVPNNPWQVGVSTATHTSCTVVASTTQFCFANDGIWQSINGAAYVQVAPGTAGVTSFNGRTGAVLPVPSDYPDAVTSVNGKTGAVVIGATTTSTTTLQ